MAREKKSKGKQDDDKDSKDPTTKENKKKVEEDSDVPVYEQREKEWKDEDGVEEQIAKIYKAVKQGMDDKSDHNNTVERCWDIYNCNLNENQGYDGTSQIYLGLVRDAIEARVTRFTGALFPTTGRYSDVISTDGVTPYETMAMCDYYVKTCALREAVIPSLIRNGDVGGQYSLFVSWKKRRRYAVEKKLVPSIGDEKTGEVEKTGTIGDISIEKINEDMPDVMVVDSRNLCILPTTVDDAEDADIVALALRMTESMVQDYIDDGTFDEDAGEELLRNFGADQKDTQPATEKKASEAAGVKTDSSGSKTALIYMMYARVKIGGKRRRCVIYQGGEALVLSCKRNPAWSDRLPIITAPAKKVPGTIWGKSSVEPVEDSQYAANDAVNMAFDSAKYSLLPVVMSDPEKNPRTGTMIMTMGALWQVDPSAVKVMEFPPLWKDAITLAELCGKQIEKSLGVNPSMIPQGASAKKPSQAQVAQEQAVAHESTADAITIIENSVLNKLLRLFYEFDYQYRDKNLVIRQFGPMGMQAHMQQIPPAQVGKHYDFQWFGVEGAKNAQQIQQGISLLNVLSKIPPQLLNGRKLDAGPLVDQLALDTYGPKLASKVVIDQRHMMTIPPQLENEMLVGGFKVPVQPNDQDVEHIKSHQAAMQITGDQSGDIRQHIMEHIMQLTQKQQQGGGAPPGQQQLSGPRPGAQVQAPTGPQNPAGTIHPDNMQDPNAMPRQ